MGWGDAESDEIGRGDVKRGDEEHEELWGEMGLN